ncbi:MAG: hypothetical protein LBH82_04650 [Bacteroidales bacterium]|jgi:hypothetical protein|nr:hypothetical protein [Bacteroidales bacterium]
MKRFITALSLFSLFIIALLAFGVSNITTRWQGDYLFALIDKFEHLKKEESPKIVLIGGSNLAFGIDSEVLSQHYDMPIVNMGLHAGMGLRFLLKGVKADVHKNDILIIIPEYSHFYTMYLGTSSTLTPMLFNVYPKGFSYLSFRQFLTIMSGIPRYSMDNLYDAYIVGHAFKEHDHRIYARANFNQYGDMTAHRTEPSYISYTVTEENPRPIDRKMLKELEEDILFFQSQGVKVVILPSAIVHTAAQNMNMEIQQVVKELHNINNEAFQYFYPENYTLPDSLGYDTRYHLLQPGIDIRMQYLIRDLDAFLESQ